MKIDKGVFLKEPSIGRKRKYPFPDMEIGDSFYMDGYSAKLQKDILNASARWAEYNGTKKKFCTRKEGEGIRVWRTV